MGGVMGLTRLAATSLHLAPARETTAVEQMQFLDNAVIIGLVKGNEYRFHCFRFLVIILKNYKLRESNE